LQRASRSDIIADMRLLTPWLVCIVVALAGLTASCRSAPVPQVNTARSEPFFVPFTEATDYQPGIEGPPRSRGMASGRVVVEPSAVGHRHSTERYEEVLVLLQGSGEIRMTGRPPLAIHAPGVAYVPPQTEHEVAASADGPLIYVYVAAPAADADR
jgi:quercetin dioxygenase-like cupin family protein